MKPRQAPIGRRAEDLAALLPATLALGVVLAWALTGGGYEALPTLSGGYEPRPWYLGALALIGLTIASAVGLRSIRLSTAAKVALTAFWLYVAWSFASILWASDQGTAMLGSVRTLVYAAAFTTFLILPWRPRTLVLTVGVFAAAAGAIALFVALRLGLQHDPSGLYINARLSYPLGYYNADAAFFTMAALTSLGISSRHQTPAVLRVAGVTLAALCLQLAVLGQSRGWLFTAPLILLLALAVLPGRLRLLGWSLGATAATGAVTPVLLRVYSGATAKGTPLPQPRLSHALHHLGARAAVTMLIADAVLAAVASLAVVADRRMTLTSRATRRLNAIAAGAIVVALLAGVGAAVAATHGHPIRRLETAWRSFANSGNSASGASRFTTLGSERVDFWRVGLHEFARHPLLGLGQDNFAESYVQRRHTGQEPRWVHSLELRALVHTGIVGAALLVLFAIAVMVGALRGGPEAPAGRRLAASLALLPALVWLVHGSLDWFWELPALSVPALAFAGAAMALGRPTVLGRTAARDQDARRRPRRLATVGRATAWLAAGLLAAGALAAATVPFLAARHLERATSSWEAKPALAYAELRSASDILPFDAQVYLLGGAIALDYEDFATARRWLTDAERQDDRQWLASFALGLADSSLGLRSQAAQQLRLAHELNPSEQLVTVALHRLHSRRPLTFGEAQERLSVRNRERFRR